MKQLIGALGLALLAAAQGVRAEGAQDVQWAVRIEQQGAVPFRGLANLDDLGKPGAMMYPAPNVVGLLAGIATHALLASSIHSHQKTAAEEEADKVLAPSQGDLATFTGQELMQAALARAVVKPVRLLGAGEQAQDAWTLQSQPVYSMTQDRGALILDNTVAVFKPGDKEGQPSYQGTVRVVSRVHEAPDLAAYWSADRSKALKDESEAMMARSLDIAVADAVADAAAPRPAAGAGAFRTVRYALGAKQGYERAELISEQCGRALIRNLRGWLMSVPLAGPSQPPAGDCAATH